jgi:hypothetical protein
MNSAWLGPLLSILSLCLAALSAIVAFRTRRQIRIDLFDTQRDLLLLTMSENDARLKALEFKARLLRRQLLEALSNHPAAQGGTTESIMAGLSELSTVGESLRRRDWTTEQVQDARYSEGALIDVRRWTLHEQVTAKTLQVYVHTILLNEAETTVDHLRSTPWPPAD